MDVFVDFSERRQQCVSHELGMSARDLSERALSYAGPVLVSRVCGLATGMELRGPDPRRPRDWALVGEFVVTDAASGESTCASRFFHKQPRFFLRVRPALKAGRMVEFGYDFYVEMVGDKIGTRVEFEYCRVGDDVTLEFEETVAL